jgi:hypothetical protein
METKLIEERIKGLGAELAHLESSHNAMVQENQKMNETFRMQVAKNQTRYAQIQGAITELQTLIKPKGNNNDNSIPTSSRSHRAANVRLSQQPQGR